MKCPSCGDEVYEGTKFCPNCGGSLASAPAASSGNPAPNSAPRTGAHSAGAHSAGAHSIAPKKTGLAVASLVLGILALLGAFISSWTIVLGVPCLVVGIVGLILGIVGAAKKQGGMAVVGIVLSVLSILVGGFAMSVSGALINMADTGNIVTITDNSSKSDDSDSTSTADNPDAITIKGAKFGTNSLGDKLVYITYSWTNNSSKKATPFFTTYSAKVYQDDIELSDGMDVDYDGNLYEDQNNVKHGKTQTFTKCYQLSNKKDKITVEVTDWISWGDEAVYASKTFAAK